MGSDGQKVALLLYMGGMEFQEIFYQIVPENAQLTFDQTVLTLDGYFQPKMNLPFERHLFRKMEQVQNETVDQFVSRLRQKAISCGFGNVDEAIRDQVIEKCRSMHLRRKFLEKSGNVLLKDLQHLTGKRNRDATVAIDRDILRVTHSALHATRCVNGVGSVVTMQCVVKHRDL